MTGLEKIVSEIQQAAQAEATSILNEANAEAQKVLDESNAKIEKRCNEIIERAEATALDTERRTKSGVELQHRQNILAAKQALIKETLAAAQEAVASLPDDQYFGLLTALAKDISTNEDAVLLVNKRDQGRVTNDFLASFPQGVKVTLGQEPADIVGGFLLSTPSMVINCSIEAVFERYHDKFSDIVLNVLFR